MTRVIPTKIKCVMIGDSNVGKTTIFQVNNLITVITFVVDNLMGKSHGTCHILYLRGGIATNYLTMKELCLSFYKSQTLRISHSQSRNIYRVRNYRGRVSNFDQSEARKQCFLASDWLKFETLPDNFVLY